MIQPQRIQHLNGKPERKQGHYVLYWMQKAQRTRYNHALEYAIRKANARDVPVVVVFGLTASYPEANERHYAFMLEGLRDVEGALGKRKIRFVVHLGSPDRVALAMADRAVLLVTDRAYLRVPKQWRAQVAEKARCRVVQVESDAVVPVEVVSDKAEYAARTIRPRIQRHLEDFLVPLDETPVKHASLGLQFSSLDVRDVDGVLSGLKIGRRVGRVRHFEGGENCAQALLRDFVASKLLYYDERRNDPSLNGVSNLSPYLHFGQVSPLDIAFQVREAPEEGGMAAYLEELIVRRELSFNFVHYDPNYDTFEAVPEWARKTLDRHLDDPRDHAYDLEDWEAGETHDLYWNAAQREMVATGKMANYMRMYWGKKLLEWSETPEQAFETALYLNNTYELDGRDANSYAGVAWCFGRHDRPWKERAVFGTVRYMNAAGLKRKFDIEAYVANVQHGRFCKGDA